MGTQRAGIYVRISKDDEGRGQGVARQEKDCRRKLESLEWELVDVYVDNDFSATAKKVRPDYQRLITDVESGRIDAVCVWNFDRLLRKPRELEDLIDLADARKIKLTHIAGEIDLSTPSGRFVARILVSMAKAESETSSLRISREQQERAEQGRRHGSPPFGWRSRQPDSRDKAYSEEPAPEQAAVIIEACDRLLAGESLRRVVIDFNARSLPSPRGKGWTSTGLRQVLRRRGNIGERVHRGVVVAVDCWPSLLPHDRWEAVVALLDKPDRRTSPREGGIRHLLSGIAKCGKCGERLRVCPASGTLPEGYWCNHCFGIRRKKSTVDDYVMAHVVARLRRPDARQLFVPDHTDEMAKVDESLDALATRALNIGEDYALGRVLDDVWTTANRVIGEQRQVLAARRMELVGSHVARDLLATEDVDLAWVRMNLERRRRVISSLIEVTILPTTKRRSFDPEAIRIDWLCDAL